jgi:hypothetical protein
MRIEFDKEDKAVEQEITAKRRIMADGSSSTDAQIEKTTKERKVPLRQLLARLHPAPAPPCAQAEISKELETLADKNNMIETELQRLKQTAEKGTAPAGAADEILEKASQKQHAAPSPLSSQSLPSPPNFLYPHHRATLPAPS